MEYSFKNSRKEKLSSFYLGDLSMRAVLPGKEEIIHYSDIRFVWINKTQDLYSVVITTAEGHQFTISNRFIHDDGKVEDKSNAYALFVRVLHMHLSEKSKASLLCVKKYHLLDRAKFLWVPVAFGIAYGLDALGVSLFHPAIHGVALAGIGLMLIFLSERSRAVERSAKREIPVEFLPA